MQSHVLRSKNLLSSILLFAFAFAFCVLLTPIARAQDLLINNGGINGILRFRTSDGAQLAPLVSLENIGPLLGKDYSWGMAFGPDGNLYICDFFAASAYKYNGVSGVYMGVFAQPGAEGLTPGSVGMTFGPDGNLYMGGGGPANSILGSSIFCFYGPTSVANAPGTFNFSVESEGGQDLITGSDGYIYCCNYLQNAVERLNPLTRTVENIIPPGSGGLDGARQMAFGPDGNLYIASEYSNSIKRYNGRTWEYIDDYVLPFHGGLFGPLAIAFGPSDGDLYVTGHVNQVLRYRGPVPDPMRPMLQAKDFLGVFAAETSGTYLLFDRYRTQLGTNVAVSPIATATLTFDTISASGVTTVTPLNESSVLPEATLPPNFQIAPTNGGLPTYFDISTTASFTGSVTLGIGYDPIVFRSDINPTGPDPRLLHYDITYINPTDGTHWKDITTTFDMVAHKVYGVTNSFSPFAIVKRAAYSWSGVLQPINTDGSSVFKKGSTIPVKFKLTGTDAGITNLKAKLYLSQTDSVDPTEANEAVSTSAGDSGNTFRYDTTAGQYIFNLSTKNLTQGTWYLRIDLGDGVSRIVQLKLKK